MTMICSTLSRLAAILSLTAVLLIACSGTETVPAVQYDQEYTNSLGMKFRLIPAGSFIMGSDAQDEHVIVKPAHRVEISKPFYMSEYEVTQEVYEKVMGTNPAYNPGPDMPVENITWFDAVAFCDKLSELTGETYRLPTEAEWEYAARAGTDTKFAWGDAAHEDFAWYRPNSERKPHPVGQKQPNAWGLYDMYGNLWEWCSDWYGDVYYAASPKKDPTGPESGETRVMKGGSWADYEYGIRAINRNWYQPDATGGIGIRVVRVLD